MANMLSFERNCKLYTRDTTIVLLWFFLKVKDQGIPVKSTSVQVNLRVTDVNDNAPVFNQTSVSFQYLKCFMTKNPLTVTFLL